MDVVTLFLLTTSTMGVPIDIVPDSTTTVIITQPSHTVTDTDVEEDTIELMVMEQQQST